MQMPVGDDPKTEPDDKVREQPESPNRYENLKQNGEIRSRKERSRECGYCGELECLCRPRFFAGQMLSEADLNRLDRYMVEKNRLQNRHLHGWGVVCGLEAFCDPCGDGVKVSEGYALSPCGDDIVVCRDALVDVCSLIKDCRQKEKRYEGCEPPKYQTDTGCEDVEEKWLLTIRYEEEPSHPVTALRPGSKTAGCGCDSPRGCGCDSRSESDVARKSTDRMAECEPSVICEGYRFEVSRYHGNDDDYLSRPSLIEERFEECAKPFMEFTDWFGDQFENLETDMDRHSQHAFCCEMKEALVELLHEHASHNCTLAERVARVSCPDPDSDLTDEEYQKAFNEAILAMFWVWLTALLECVCSVLLPPCQNADDPRVPLAMLTVKKRDCKIVRVCNWTVERKFATTFPNLQYWLGVLPHGKMLRSVLEKACCGWLDRIFGQFFGASGGIVSAETGGGNAEKAQGSRWKATRLNQLRSTRDEKKQSYRTRQFTRLSLDSLMGRTGHIDPRDLFKGFAGLDDENGNPYLADYQRENPLQLLLGSTMAPSLMRGVMPAETMGMFDPGGLMAGREGAAPEKDREMAEMRAEMAEMRKKMETQEKTISSLKRKVDKRG